MLIIYSSISHSNLLLAYFIYTKQYSFVSTELHTVVLKMFTNKYIDFLPFQITICLNMVLLLLYLDGIEECKFNNAK